jgi:methanogenic corrinoid protein MtbC1
LIDSGKDGTNIDRMAGLILQEKHSELVESVVNCHYRKDQTTPERYDDHGKYYLIRDTGYHIEHLSSALRFSSILLFESYIEWLKVLMASLNVKIEDCITNFLCINEVIENTLPDELVESTHDYMKAAVDRLQGSSTDVVTHFGQSVPLSLLATQYMNTLLQGDIDTAMKTIMDQVRDGQDLKDIYLNVFGSSQYEVGRLWLMREISVAQEHFCTESTKLIMSQLYSYLRPPKSTRGKVLLTCVAGELHDMGMRILNDFFLMDGWNTVFLGCNTPKDSVVDIIKNTKPDLAAFSVTMNYNLPSLEELIQTIRKSDDTKQTKILVGGNPFTLDPGLWQRIGADGYASDANEALEVASRLVS